MLDLIQSTNVFYIHEFLLNIMVWLISVRRNYPSSNFESCPGETEVLTLTVKMELIVLLG